MTRRRPARVLVVAGSDSGGGAGIQADIKTITMLGGFATTAITALTAQNSLGVQAAMAVPADFVLRQVESVLADIGADAIKIGMIGSPETAAALADRLPPEVPMVFDPVMVSTSGSALADAATIAAFDRLMAKAALVTPNLPELEALSGRSLPSLEEAEAAARELALRTKAVVLAKGGHFEGSTIIDLLVSPHGHVRRWESPRIDTRHSHGTGCTLASAIATYLGEGRPLEEAVERARDFVRRAMLAAPGFGAGAGPMGHCEAGGDAMNLNQVTLPAADYAASVEFYRALGLTQIVDSPGRYARFECPGGATLSIHVEEGAKAGDAMICLESAELDAWVERLLANGIAFETLPEDQRWGWREAHLRDPAGNRLCLYRAGEYRRFPPWRLLD
ncbi:MAG: hydroxymethylpyrimidine/phosphomethylpyrimidine kinase [Sphingomonadales bacterium]|jgi:hydroxymethylpyrimidine/phosphomethylpyrimidine kinase|nr:hydroxymethylpyrimidine/phosphomethylpyrimidine kinase [Sphingomonadales bacterium]